MVVEFLCGFLFWGGFIAILFLSWGLGVWLIENPRQPKYPGTNLLIEKEDIDAFSATSMWMSLKE